jgi:single-strand DNA-binding protein
MGRLTKDPGYGETKNGTKKANFTLAIDRPGKGDDGERAADFIYCIAFGPTADFIHKYFFKGKMIALVGRLQTRKYQTTEGQNQSVTEVLADSVYFAGDKSKSEDPYGGNATYEKLPWE